MRSAKEMPLHAQRPQNEIRKQPASRDPEGFVVLFSIYGSERGADAIFLVCPNWGFFYFFLFDHLFKHHDP